MTRFGNWMGLASGGKFWPLDPSPDDVRLPDIARALSQTCRFGGRCNGFYSVAQHCVWVADYVAEQHPGDAMLAMHALLHDAAEAYVGDVVSPLKSSLYVRMPDRFEPFADVEERIMRAIRRAFQLPEPTAEARAIIKHADTMALAVEAKDLIGDVAEWNLPDCDHLPMVMPLDCAAARHLFGNRFVGLDLKVRP